MRNECDRVGDAIWEHVRFGAEIPDDAQRHIAGCPECDRVMSESRGLSGIMRTAACVPKAPDCTEAVMSRISALPARRPVWAYVATLLAVLVISGFLLFHPHGGPTQIARQVAKPSQATPYQPPVANVQDTRPAIQPRENGAQRRPVTAVYHRPRVRHLVQPRVMMAHTDTRQRPAPVEQAPTDRRSIMAVAVTWSAEPSQSSSYAYTERNETTGETTTCRVEKSPGAVSIFMECKPSGQERPSKGA